MTALELSQASLNRQAALEAEILLNMGKAPFVSSLFCFRSFV